jgi:hypothetical protein
MQGETARVMSLAIAKTTLSQREIHLAKNRLSALVKVLYGLV